MQGQPTKQISITTDNIRVYHIHISDIQYAVQFINMPIGQRIITLCDIYNEKHPYFSAFGIATKHPNDTIDFEIGQKVSLRSASNILYRTYRDIAIDDPKGYKTFFGRLSMGLSSKAFKSIIKSEIHIVKESNDKV